MSPSINIPELSLVLLMGATGSGKSTFAARHFKPSEIVSSDACRALVSNDENNQSATADAFALARYITGIRLKSGLLTVIDATNVHEADRTDWIKLAREFHVLPIAIVLNMPANVCSARNSLRSNRNMGAHVIPRHISNIKRSIKRLKQEGFRHVFEFRSVEEADAVTEIVRAPLYNNKKHEHGPLDIIGDIHGCYDELTALLTELGYIQNGTSWAHPAGRKAVFAGDMADRGPKTPEVFRLIMAMTAAGDAYCLPGNHDEKLKRWLDGKNVQLTHGLDKSVAQFSKESPEFREEVRKFIDGLISHYVFDEGRLVVSHAGLREEMHGRGSGDVRRFCLYGETTGETDEFGLPVRHNWAAEYKGRATVVYGHTPVVEAQWLNNTIDIDTGCVFGGSLTALRYPERELVSVRAFKVYAEPVRPIGALPEPLVPFDAVLRTLASSSTESVNMHPFPNTPGLSLQHENDDVPDIADFTGRQLIETGYNNFISVPEANAAAALEVMSRFAVNPKWLIYLPPTMSPCETSALPDFLEYPANAFDYYKAAGVKKVVCEEKHMGSRAIVVVAKNEETVKSRFGITGEGIGVIYTRTGRAFFNDKATEQDLLHRLNQALSVTGFYDRFKTDWVCLDTELMPWNAKAQALIDAQYAAVGAAATKAMAEAVKVLEQFRLRNAEGEALAERYKGRLNEAESFVTAYRNYCRPVNKLEDLKLAPFHILATEGKVHTDENHVWHMEEIKKMCLADEEVLIATHYRIVDLESELSIQAATDWWLSLTAEGGEGMVVKPLDFIARNQRGIVQPAVKVRGREYLRIIYGPEYTEPQNLSRLKSRGLAAKRSLAIREFALGLEGLDRFVAKKPLSKVHSCAFGVLALESEPLDPRL
ncbi:MAG: polynucleotide kinase-phosphatase [Bacteroidota bacterium]